MDAKQREQTGVGLRCRVCTGLGTRVRETIQACGSQARLCEMGPSAKGLVRHVGRGGAPRGGVAVAEHWGWRLGLVGGGGSAGSVLRSQGTLGPAKLSRCRARGIRVSTFLCSLRPGPAAASWIGCSMRGSDSRRFGMRHRFSQKGLQDLGPSPRGQVRHVGRGAYGAKDGAAESQPGRHPRAVASRYRSDSVNRFSSGDSVGETVTPWA